MKVKSPENIKELLWEVLEIEPAKRREFLDEAGTTAEIRAEIESLLSFEAVSADFMSLAITDFSKDFDPEVEAAEISLIGQEVGVYEIIGELGIGGMGAVYLAARKDGKFAQKVAVKMLKREFNVEKIRQTFQREKEILAKLNHPNIARLLDAGTTADGVPYLVMEFIEGLPIDKFCEEKNLSLNLRLKLFNKVCEAVSFAHRNLIIHRDLKPSNILVTEKGEPKLLDFGISKLLDAEENTSVTAFGAMTPEYASPEQIKGETVTTTTDIYSLGVVLYKILTNAHPFDLKGKTNGELLKTISESEPIAPSAISNFKFQISNYENPKAEIQNPKSLKGDIDNIILKSLSKEPERRYETVEQFSADIWRHIDGLPVLARPATLSYRASKFFRRNKLAVIAGILIFLSLITGLAVAIRQTNFAREQARISAIETENARIEEAKAKKITAFTSKVLSYANPGWYAEGARFGGNARVIDVVEDLSDKIDTEFAGEADVAAELHHNFAEIFGWASLGETGERREKFSQKRISHALRALELRKQFYGTRHELIAKDLYYTYYYAGDDNAQAQMLAQAIDMMRETNPRNLNLPFMLQEYSSRLMKDDPNFREIYHRNAIPATDLGSYELAEQYIIEMLELFRFHYGDGSFMVAIANCNLTYSGLKQNKIAESAPPYQICKQAENGFPIESQNKAIKLLLDKIEALLNNNNRRI